MLHVAVEGKNESAIRKINSWLPCRKEKLAIEYTRSVKIREMLREYMQWRPCREETDWLGPMFRKKAVALFIAFNKLKRKYPGLVKDVALKILKFVAEEELQYLRRPDDT